MALNHGYKIMHTYEILHWRELEQIDEETKKGGIFHSYINTFLRIKAEASGFPADVKMDDDSKLYINEFKKQESMLLEQRNIKHNPGLRSLTKLALNSFYGKFGQRVNMKKCVFFTQAEDIYKLLTDYSKKVSDFHVINENLVVMEYTKKQDFMEVNNRTNVTVATFCTRYARMKLWKLMHSLKGRVLYHNTDSVIYSYTPNNTHPPIGKFSGQLTDELTYDNVGCSGCQEGHWIIEIISSSAKNYGYQLNSGQTTCNIRGFSLNYNASQTINLNSMREALECWMKGITPPELKTTKTLILRKRLKAYLYILTKCLNIMELFITKGEF